MSNTAADSLISCLRLGQTTLSNSSLVPWKKLPKLNPPPEVSAISASFFLATVVYPPSLVNTAILCLFSSRLTASLHQIYWKQKSCKYKTTTPEINSTFRHFSRCTIGSGCVFYFRARPGGLEPPTSGFGDLRSTN